MKTKRYTIVRKMSARDYANLLNYFQTGELEMDLSNIDPSALAQVEKRKMQLTDEEKVKMNEFFKTTPYVISAAAFVDGLPKIGSIPKVEVTQANPMLVSVASPLPIEPKDPDKVFPSWVKDPNKKIYPDNINLTEVIRILKTGEQTIEQFRADIDALICDYERPQDILTAEPHLFEEVLEKRLKYCVYFFEIAAEAANIYQKYLAMMEEPEPSEEENFKRYSNITYQRHFIPKNPKLIEDMKLAAEVSDIKDNQVIFDDGEIITEYENEEDLRSDLLYLVNKKEIEEDDIFNIFGKDVSAEKVVRAIYKKYPQGEPGKDKFYRTRREAYEDGALEL